LNHGQRTFLSGIDLSGNIFTIGDGIQKKLTSMKLSKNLPYSELDKFNNKRKKKRKRKLTYKRI